MADARVHVVGISGPAGSGKSTAAHCITQFADHSGEFSTIEEVSLADPVKRVLLTLYGGRDDIKHACWGTSRLRDTPLPEAVHTPDGHTLRTVRHALQFIGTDLFRCCWGESVWVDALRHHVDTVQEQMPHLDNAPALVVVPDVRFPNEVDAILDMPDGLIIRLDWHGSPEPTDHHTSETALNDYPWKERAMAGQPIYRYCRARGVNSPDTVALQDAEMRRIIGLHILGPLRRTRYADEARQYSTEQGD